MNAASMTFVADHPRFRMRYHPDERAQDVIVCPVQHLGAVAIQVLTLDSKFDPSLGLCRLAFRI
jgi:hypothetical protein